VILRSDEKFALLFLKLLIVTASSDFVVACASVRNGEWGGSVAEEMPVSDKRGVSVGRRNTRLKVHVQ
jgi:hypothetical protein